MGPGSTRPEDSATVAEGPTAAKMEMLRTDARVVACQEELEQSTPLGEARETAPAVVGGTEMATEQVPELKKVQGHANCLDCSICSRGVVGGGERGDSRDPYLDHHHVCHANNSRHGRG